MKFYKIEIENKWQPKLTKIAYGVNPASVLCQALACLSHYKGTITAHISETVDPRPEEKNRK